VAEAQALRALIAAQPIAALGTLRAGADGPEPFVSMVPVAWPAGSADAVIHVSALSPHTRDLLSNPRVSLMLVAPRSTGDEPLALARLSLQADAMPLDPGSPAHAAAEAAYRARFPGSDLTFGLGDFRLVSLRTRSARFVAGFGRAHALGQAAWQALMSGRDA
jgi:putative heme iron utilization protein